MDTTQIVLACIGILAAIVGGGIALNRRSSTTRVNIRARGNSRTVGIGDMTETSQARRRKGKK